MTRKQAIEILTALQERVSDHLHREEVAALRIAIHELEDLEEQEDDLK